LELVERVGLFDCSWHANHRLKITVAKQEAVKAISYRGSTDSRHSVVPRLYRRKSNYAGMFNDERWDDMWYLVSRRVKKSDLYKARWCCICVKRRANCRDLEFIRKPFEVLPRRFRPATLNRELQLEVPRNYWKYKIIMRIFRSFQNYEHFSQHYILYIINLWHTYVF